MSRMERGYVSVCHAARILELSGMQVRRLADRGDIKMTRTVLGRLIDEKDVRRLALKRRKARVLRRTKAQGGLK